MLSPNSTTYPYLLFSTSMTRGDLIVYDTNKLEEINTIACHKTIILKIAVNFNGNLAATCSTNGNMIRVFSLPNGEKLFTF